MAKRGGRSGILEERMVEKGGNSKAFPFSVFCLRLAMIPLEFVLTLKAKWIGIKAVECYPYEASRKKGPMRRQNISWIRN